MADDEVKPIEVSIPETKPGSVQFMNKSAFTNPAPEKLKRIIEALVYFCAGLGGVVGGSDLFSGRQAKIIAVALAVVILALGGLKIVIGVKPDEK